VTHGQEFNNTNWSQKLSMYYAGLENGSEKT